MEPQSGKKKDIIICPIISAWVSFTFKIIIDIAFFILALDGLKKLREKYNGYYAALIIDITGSLVASILVTLSFQKNNYCLYKIGFIIALVLAISTTIIISTFLGSYIVLPVLIVPAGIEWSLFIVQMLYNNKTKSSFLESEFNFNFLNNAPQAIQPQVLVESKASV